MIERRSAIPQQIQNLRIICQRHRLRPRNIARRLNKLDRALVGRNRGFLISPCDQILRINNGVVCSVGRCERHCTPGGAGE